MPRTADAAVLDILVIYVRACQHIGTDQHVEVRYRECADLFDLSDKTVAYHLRRFNRAESFAVGEFMVYASRSAKKDYVALFYEKQECINQAVAKRREGVCKKHIGCRLRKRAPETAMRFLATGEQLKLDARYISDERYDPDRGTIKVRRDYARRRRQPSAR